MGVIADRVKAIITRSGESLAFTKLAGTAGTFSVKGLATVLDSGTRGQYLTSVELMSLDLPALVVRFAGDSTVKVADTFARDSLTWTCLKVGLERVNAESVILVGVFSGA